MAARLEAAGTPVSIVARGAHLAAVQQDGLVLLSGGERIVTRPKAVPHGDAIGPQDYLILTLKAHSVEPALAQLAPLVGPETTIVTAINGIPWWYCHGPARAVRRAEGRLRGPQWDAYRGAAAGAVSGVHCVSRGDDRRTRRDRSQLWRSFQPR